MSKAKIIGMGSYLPEKVLSNKDLEKMVETSDEWIVKRTGIKERRIAAKDEAASDLGIPAAKLALEDAGLTAQDLDLILVATMTPDYISSSTATIIQDSLGAGEVAAMDVQAACSGFIYALSMAKAYVEAGMYKNILLVATEKMSDVIDFTDRNSCILFGDGASAVVISSEGPGLEIGAVTLGSDGKQVGIVKVPGGGSRIPISKECIDKKLHFVTLDGREVFKQAVRKMVRAAEECLSMASLTHEEIDWVIPHQANLRIMTAIARSMALPEGKIYETVHKYGNTSASSVGIALDELSKEKEIRSGDRLLLVAFGAGLTWGAAILTQTE